jgi:hypothetical protein
MKPGPYAAYITLQRLNGEVKPASVTVLDRDFLFDPNGRQPWHSALVLHRPGFRGLARLYVVTVGTMRLAVTVENRDQAVDAGCIGSALQIHKGGPDAVTSQTGKVKMPFLTSQNRIMRMGPEYFRYVRMGQPRALPKASRSPAPVMIVRRLTARLDLVHIV